MVRRSFRIGLWVGLILGVVLALRRTVRVRRAAETPFSSPEPWPAIRTEPDVREEWTAPPIEVPKSAEVEVVEEPVWPPPVPPGAPAPAPPLGSVVPPPKARAPRAKKAPAPKKPPKAWVEPEEGVCPASHPIKAKLASRLFHLPGMFAYDRTKPDRCYASAELAEADGLTRAKR